MIELIAVHDEKHAALRPDGSYPMCKSQAAQIDCRRSECMYNKGGGYCKNVAPAITLNQDGKTFVCWSEEIEESELLTYQDGSKINIKQPNTMIPNYNNRMIGTYEQRSKSAQPLPVPPPEKPSLIRRILKWCKESWELPNGEGSTKGNIKYTKGGTKAPPPKPMQ